ncbi:MAG TPA: sialidase family protein [Ktedonobacteraceae bacterium]|nr:sialidase family protein [Ktedonobacteraceae bacterium]
MRKTPPLLIHWLLMLSLLALVLSACSQDSNHPASSPTPAPSATSGYSLAGGGACVQLGQHPQAPFANVRVSHDSYLAHSEPMLAENLRNPLNLVGGTKFFTDPKRYQFQIGYFASFDGGCTWTDGGLLPGFQQRFTLTSDISFAFGTRNNVYALVLYEAHGGLSGVAVSTSIDGGKTFGNPVSVFESNENQVFNDKPWITVDQTNGPHSGDIYVVWSYDYGNDCGAGNPCVEEVAFSRSSDGGNTFSTPQFIEGNAPFCANPLPDRPTHSTRCDGAIGATPVVMPDGTLAVAYLNSYSAVVQAGNAIPDRQLVVTSPDGGTTWTQPVSIAIISDIDGYFPPETYRNLSLPAFACDPRTGQLYVTWSDKATGDADILFSASSDRGRTWSAPLRVNDDPLRNGEEQFQPQMAVAPDGVISISFFDTRLDPAHKMIDVYLAQSRDHGATFLKNERVTTQSWDSTVDAPVDSFGSQFIGDYQGLAADNLFVHPFWNDTRTGAQEIFTAAVPSV